MFGSRHLQQIRMLTDWICAAFQVEAPCKVFLRARIPWTPWARVFSAAQLNAQSNVYTRYKDVQKSDTLPYEKYQHPNISNECTKLAGAREWGNDPIGIFNDFYHHHPIPIHSRIPYSIGRSPTDRWQLEQSTWYPRCPIRHPGWQDVTGCLEDLFECSAKEE